MIPKESQPALVLIVALSSLGEVPRHGGQAHVETKLLELGLNLSGTPGVLAGKTSNQIAQFRGDRRPAGDSIRDRSPVEAEPLPVLADDGLGLDDEEGVFPARPEARQCNPEGVINRSEVRARILVGIDRKLLAQDQLNDRLFAPTPEQGGERRDHDRDVSKEDADHRTILLEAMVKIESEP